MSEENKVMVGTTLWHGRKYEVNLHVSISQKRREIYIGKDVLRVLGAPEYICMKVNQRMDSFFIMQGQGKEYMSFKVPDNIYNNHQITMRVSSKGFVNSLFGANGLDGDKTYCGDGIYSEKLNAVVFDIKEMFPKEQEKLDGYCFRI